MLTTPITGTPSEVLVEQLVASGIKYVFYNSGSREALFFDALNNNPNIDGILALHEGSVASMAGAYTQVNSEPAVMVVHLGAGLAQCMGQLYNIWFGGLPVVVITFAGDTGSFTDRINLDLDSSFSPASISVPMAKETWTVIEPEGLPAAVDRALRVATTPPFGPVHLAVYDKMLENQQVSTEIIHGGAKSIKAGNASDEDLGKILDALDKADKPLLYVGDGVWKSGADKLAAELATHFGVVVASPETDLRGISLKHPLHMGMSNTAFDSYEPDVIVSLGVRHQGSGKKEDNDPFRKTKQIIALGSGLEYLKNYPGLEVGIIANEKDAISRMLEIANSDYVSEKYSERRQVSLNLVNKERTKLRDSLMPSYEKGLVRPTKLVDAIDSELERIGGGYIANEQFAARYDAVSPGLSDQNNILMKGAGGSEGWGVGAGIGAKLAAGDAPVIGLVGDGSLYYADSGLWTAVHHNIPLLYVIPNNGAYGIVAGFFGQSGGRMSDTGNYQGVVLDGIDPVKIADAFGMDGERVDDEEKLNESIQRGLEIVTKQNRPYLLDVRLPIGLPEGGVADQQYRMK
ncbi:MAG: thiamine pyrophosphate-dependent enzyme [Chloroflexota bacterium]|nr:thiamine pyrophosphate-dependent enzyme [Chloroflexota bacterium]